MQRNTENSGNRLISILVQYVGNWFLGKRNLAITIAKMPQGVNEMQIGEGEEEGILLVIFGFMHLITNEQMHVARFGNI